LTAIERTQHDRPDAAAAEKASLETGARDRRPAMELILLPALAWSA
jgi:hypothetical protein